jgi:hypothetical protein
MMQPLAGQQNVTASTAIPVNIAEIRRNTLIIDTYIRTAVRRGQRKSLEGPPYPL